LVGATGACVIDVSALRPSESLRGWRRRLVRQALARMP
jgi:hypothetical protein